MSVSPVPSSNGLSSQQAKEVERICAQFAELLRTWTGQRPRAEDFLGEVANPARTVLLQKLLQLEWNARTESESVSLEEYRQRFSHEERVTEWLDEIFGGQAMFDAASPSALEQTCDAGTESAGSRRVQDVGTRSLDEYEILGTLGRGGMGIVYKARHKSLDRIVALKRVLGGPDADPQQLERFRLEAEAVARLQHPHIVQIFEVGQQDGLPYFSLEYCSGGSLKDKLAGTPLPAQESAHLVEQLATGMEAAHQKGVIHRDLKPANVLLAEDGTPKIADFGLAKKLDDAGQTRTGAVVGTPSYMAPEQAAGRTKEIGPACDVYALGAILYECLTGRPPFRSAGVMDTVMQVINDVPVTPSRLNAKVPFDLETICLKCLAKEPQKRYGSASALAADLARFQRGEPIEARPVGKVERLWRWCVRNPALASALAAAMLILVAGTVVSSLFAIEATDNAKRATQNATQSRLAQRAAETSATAEATARKQADLDKQQAQEQRDRAEFLLYVGQLARAQREFEAGNGGQALQLLDSCQWNLRGWEHDHLWSRFNSKQTLEGHTAIVSSGCFSPDGKRILSASSDLTLKLWDAQTGKEIRTLRGHRNRVGIGIFSPDGKRILSGSNDATMKLWDAQTGRLIRTFSGHKTLVSSVSFSPDGQRILSGSFDNTLKLWDTETGKEIRTFTGHRSRVQSVSFSPDGQHIVSTGWDMTLNLWEAETGKLIRTLTGHSSYVTSVCFHPEGKFILSGSYDGLMKLWDAQTGREIRTFTTGSGTVNSVCFSPDGTRCLSGTSDKTVTLWDVQTGRRLFTLTGHADMVTSVSFSPEGKRILSGSYDTTLKLWDAQTGQEIRTLVGHKGTVSSTCYHPDGKRILSGSHDGTLKLWDVQTDKLVRTFPGHADRVSSVSFGPDGKHILSGSYDKTLKLWDAQTGREIRTFTGHTEGIMSVSISPDGQRLLSGSYDRTVKLWDAQTGQEIRTLEGHRGGVGSVCFSPDGQSILSGSVDRTLKLWDAQTGRVIHTFTGHTDRVHSVIFSPDGQRILSGSADKTLKLWDARTRQEMRTLTGHADIVSSVTFSPDGTLLLSGSWDKTLKLWDAQSGEEILTLKGHSRYVESVCFSPDGQCILSGSYDGTLKLWDAPTRQELLPLIGHTAPVRRASFSANGERVFGQDQFGKVLAWDTRTGKLLPKRAPSFPKGPPLTRLPDGRFLRIAKNRILLSDPQRQQRIAERDRQWYQHWSRNDPD